MFLNIIIMMVFSLFNVMGICTDQRAIKGQLHANKKVYFNTLVIKILFSSRDIYIYIYVHYVVCMVNLGIVQGKNVLWKIFL